MKLLKVGHYILTWILISGMMACGTKHRMFESIASPHTGIDFANNLTYTDSLTVLDFEYMFNGAGVALLDVNRDGLLDVFFTGNMVSCRLFLNKGKMQFEDITDRAGLRTTGWCYGASVVDINQDGYPDIYVCKAGNRKTPADSMHNEFFINNGNNTFTESAKQMGLDDDGYDIQAAFLDYDHDGDLDMYLLRNSFVSYNRNTVRVKQLSGEAASTNRLFRNNGDGTFANVSNEAGIRTEGFGLGVNICDINNDGWPDVYVSNDFLTNDVVWVNNRDGTFSDQAGSYLRHTTYNAMGNDVADFNNDGLPDIVEVDMLPPDNKRWKLTMMGNTYEQYQQGLSFGYQPQYVRNSLQLNNGDGTFSEIGQLAGVSATEWSWAPLLADFDNDGQKDLFVANGYRQDITNLDFIMFGRRSVMGSPAAKRKERIDMLKNFPGVKVPDYLFHNNGDLTFTNVAADWGITENTYSNGAAYGDLDNDGDLDLVINNLDQPASVYENHADVLKPGAGWLTLKFKGPKGNRDGLGTKVYAWQAGNLQYQYYSPYRGYLSTVEPFVHFGFPNKKIDSLRVIWPDGREQHIDSPSSNALLTIDYAASKDAKIFSEPAGSLRHAFINLGDSVGVAYRHREDEFVDFKLQPLMPHLLSHEGPAIAVADVNGDGLEDFFVGAAAGGHPQLFLQKADGRYTAKEFSDSATADNMGTIFFDADNDGDNDLYVAAGGMSDKKNGDVVYQHKLYVNDGKGNFTWLPGAIPAINTSASSVVASDYDHDGDLDLFICGRVSPGEYPLSPRSFLLRNDSKNGTCAFTDVTSGVGFGPGTLGMVTDAIWTDFDNDGWQDLIVAGEFMPVRFYKNVLGRFREVTDQTGLSHTSGWWNSLCAGDFDNDGDIDYVAGNLGLNGPYKATPDEPVCIYANDYDNNGRLDPVMCHFAAGEEYVVHSREDMNKQIAAMKTRFRDFASYAGVTFREAFLPEEIKKAYVVKAETFASSYFENLGNGKFREHQLPLTAQFAPIYGMLAKDFDGDGNLDILAVGNSYATEVQTGQYDAQGAVVIKGDGKGNFSADRSQIDAVGDNKAVAELLDAHQQLNYLVSTNNDSMKLFRRQGIAPESWKILPKETFADIFFKNGRKRREEFSYGQSYLSQSGRYFIAPPQMDSAILHTADGTKRTLKLKPPHIE